MAEPRAILRCRLAVDPPDSGGPRQRSANGQAWGRRRHAKFGRRRFLAVAPDIDLIKLDDALLSLSQKDEQQSRVVEMRFFGGLSIEETAEALGVSASTVKRDWL